MGLSIRFFIALMFVAVMAGVFLMKPYHMQKRVPKKFPQVAFVDFDSYEIKTDGVKNHLRGKTAWKYHKKLLVDEPLLWHLGRRGVESVQSKTGLLMEGKGIELKHDVRLSRIGQWKMRTTYLYYDMKKKAYTTDKAPFVIRFGESVIRGRRLSYYQKSGKIYAHDIDADIDEKDL